jgi:hypothetical protein
MTGEETARFPERLEMWDGGCRGYVCSSGRQSLIRRAPLCKTAPSVVAMVCRAYAASTFRGRGDSAVPSRFCPDDLRRAIREERLP